MCVHAKKRPEKKKIPDRRGHHMLSRFRGISDDVRQTKKEKKKIISIFLRYQKEKKNETKLTASSVTKRLPVT
jgi:hypothetical protein